MPLYVVITDHGMGLFTARDIRQARSNARKTEGQHVKEVRPAKDKDIAWVQGMGGYVPLAYRISARASAGEVAWKDGRADAGERLRT